MCLLSLASVGCQATVQTNFPATTEIPPTNNTTLPSTTPDPTHAPKPTSTEVSTDTPTPLPPTITAQPERLVASMDELIGVWRGYSSDINNIYMEFVDPPRAELSWERGGLMNKDQFSFEDGKITWGKVLYASSTPQECIENPKAIYEVYISFRGDQPEKLRFVLVGEDHCYDRQDFLDGNTLTWVGTEVP